MTAKYYTTTHTHPFTWDTVASAIFQRYPNPMASHVLSEDTVHREVRGHLLYTRRFLTKTNKVPKWGERWLPSNLKRMVPLVEESHVDRQSKVVVTYTRNVGLSRFMSAVEKVLYLPDPDNPSQTLAVKEAWIESGLYGIRSAVKNFGIERFKNNCMKATEGFNHVLAHLQERQPVFLSQAQKRKFHEIRSKGETAIRNAKDMAKAKAANTARVLAESEPSK